MMMRHRAALLLFTAIVPVLLAVESAQAQVFTPSLLSPRQGGDVGVYLADGFHTSDGVAVEGIWRRSYGAYDLGLRAGLGDTSGGVAALLGADYRNPLELPTAPVVIAVTGTAQAALGDDSGLGLGAGLSVGGSFAPGSFTITPYLHPRAALVRSLREDEELDLEVLADLGVDVQLRRGLTVRLALGFGAPTADFAIGLAWR